MTKWFCMICWRNGEIAFEDQDLADSAHRLAVVEDISALRTPDPVKMPPGHRLLEKFPGVDCPGNVRFGEMNVKRRFKRPDLPTMEFVELSGRSDDGRS